MICMTEMGTIRNAFQIDLSPSSRGSPLVSEIVQTSHETQKADHSHVEALDTLWIQAVVHSYRQPVGRGHEFIPPLAIEILFFLGCPSDLLLLELSLASQAEEIAGHTDQPRTAAPCDPFGDAATLLDNGQRQHPLETQVVDVLEGLETDVCTALEKRDASERRIHLGRRLFRGQRPQPQIHGDQARQSQGGPRVGDQRSQRRKK